MDSLVRFELFRGSLRRRLYPPGREVAAEQRADPGCAAPRDLRHRCSPSPPPCLASSLPSPRVPSPFSPSAPLSRAATCRRATVTMTAAAAAAEPAALYSLVGPGAHRCNAQPDHWEALANQP